MQLCWKLALMMMMVLVCVTAQQDGYCIVKKSQHKAGPAKNLFHKDGSIPAVRDPVSHPEDASTSANLSATRDVGFQTDSPQLHSVVTQLFRRTLQAQYRSISSEAQAVQTQHSSGKRMGSSSSRDTGNRIFYTEKDKFCSDPKAPWIQNRLKGLKEIVD